MTKLRTLIVGCGNIAGRFDSARSVSEPPLTHAGAYAGDSRFSITACVEPDHERRTAFMQRWHVPLGFRSLQEAVLAGQQFDVVSICSPTGSHAQDLDGALELRPKAVFCEKPVTTSAQLTMAAVQRYRSAGVLLAVNYTRRWDPAIVELRRSLRERRWGALRSIVAYYNKGLLNNGSHLLDLLTYFFDRVVVEAVGKPIDDYLPNDPSVPVWLEADGCVPVQVACGHARDFAFFEVQLVFADAVITMEEAGMSWRERHPVDSRVFSGYRILDEGARRAGGYEKAMLRSVGNIFEAIEHGAPLASTGESALVAQRLCEEIRQR
jgi:predicted dehydrogenase